VDFLSYSLETGSQDALTFAEAAAVNDRLDQLVASWDTLEEIHGKCTLLADLESFIERAGWDA
jgi:hypothetical protein